jgi:cobalt-precorrin 5A hydrolase
VGPDKFPFPDTWLILRPPVLHVGLGCNRNTPLGELEDLLTRSFNRHDLSVASIRSLASIKAKDNEAGLLALARELGVPIRFFSADLLAGVPTPNPSPTVLEYMGVPSVCEAAAILAAQHGRLIVPKQKSPNATLAVAQADWTSSALVPETFTD